MSLDELNLISETNLINKGFRKRGILMVKIIHDQEIRFVQIVPQLFAFDRMSYIVQDRRCYDNVGGDEDGR